MSFCACTETNDMQLATTISTGITSRDNEHRIVAPTIPIHSLKACGLCSGGHPPEYPLTKLKHKNGDDIFEQRKR